MRLAIVRRRWVSDGGGERFTAALAAALDRLDHEVTVVSTEWAGAPEGTRWRRVPAFGRDPFTSLLSFTIGAEVLLRRSRYDVVQSHEKLLSQDVYRAGDGCHREWLRQRSRYRPSVRQRVVRWAPHHRLLLLLERYLLTARRYRVIVANSEGVRRDLRRHYGVPPADIRVIYNGVDLDRFSPANRVRLRDLARARYEIPRNAVLLLFLGSGFERKGLADVLEALPLVDDGVHLLVGGRDLRADRYQDLARCLAVAQRVRFIGAVVEPDEVYAAADAFILPSIYEPFSNACLEALASGLPLITTAANGASELLTGDLAALTLARSSDREGLAERITRMSARDTREALGAQARAVAEAWPLSRAVNEFIAVYQRVGADSSSNTPPAQASDAGAHRR